jgi:hypothetical protein
MKCDFQGLFPLFILLLACTGTRSVGPSQDVVCLFFDERQCAADEFAKLYPAGAPLETRSVAVERYLEGLDVRVMEIKVQPDFHDTVCEACDVCPELHRYFVKTDSTGYRIVSQQGLLNFGQVNCSEF